MPRGQQPRDHQTTNPKKVQQKSNPGFLRIPKFCRWSIATLIILKSWLFRETETAPGGVESKERREERDRERQRQRQGQQQRSGAEQSRAEQHTRAHTSEMPPPSTTAPERGPCPGLGQRWNPLATLPPVPHESTASSLSKRPRRMPWPPCTRA